MKLLIIFLAILSVNLTGCAQMQRAEQERNEFICRLDKMIEASRDSRGSAYPYGYIPGVGIPTVNVYIRK